MFIHISQLVQHKLYSYYQEAVNRVCTRTLNLSKSCVTWTGVILLTVGIHIVHIHYSMLRGINGYHASLDLHISFGFDQLSSCTHVTSKDNVTSSWLLLHQHSTFICSLHECLLLSSLPGYTFVYNCVPSLCIRMFSIVYLPVYTNV